MDYRVLKSLVGKLNPTCRNGLESAAGLCLSRTNYEVEIEHWLLKLAETPNTDLAAILRYFEIDSSRFTSGLIRVIDHLKTGNSRSPALSPNLVKLVREAWIVASIEFGAHQVRSGHLI